MSNCIVANWGDIVHVGALHVAIARSIPTWTDGERLRSCFGGKRVVLLGDSTMTEHVHMLLLILTGFASQHAESDVRQLVSRLTHQHRFGARVDVRLPPTIDATARFFPNHRRMTIDWSTPTTNGSIYHRFAGHPNVDENGLGVATLNDDAFRADVDAPLAAADIVVVGTDHHTPNATSAGDVWRELDAFYRFLAAHSPARVKAFVSSRDIDAARSAAMEAAARANDVAIVDTSELRAAFLATHACSNKHCFGTRRADAPLHSGAIAYGFHGGATLALSSLLTEALLAKLCP